MERHTRLLSYLLVVQIVVVALVWYPSTARDEQATGNLVAVSVDDVTAIEVAENTEAHVRIERTGTGWRLPGYDGLPADAEKVISLISKLEDADARWPVATSEASAARFEVSEQKFQRRIRIHAGDALAAEIYLGTSPGFRKVHARRGGSNDVFAITFANYEAPAKPEDWLDKTLLRPPGELVGLARKDSWQLIRQDDTWVLDGLAEGERTDGDAARDVASRASDLRVLGRADAPPAEGLAPVFELVLTTASEARVLRFYRPDAAGDYVVGSDALPAYFRVAAYIGDALAADRAALLGRPASEANDASSPDDAGQD